MWTDPRDPPFFGEYRIIPAKMHVLTKNRDGEVAGAWANPVIVKKPDGAPDIPFSDIHADHPIRIVFTGELGRVEVWVRFPAHGEYRYKLKHVFRDPALFRV